MLPLPPLTKALASNIPAANRKLLHSSLDSLGSNSSSLDPPPFSGSQGVLSDNAPEASWVVSYGCSPVQSSAQLTPTISFENGQLLEDLDASVPILPSQLRRRHESMKLLARTVQKQQAASVHEPIDHDVPSNALHPQDDEDSKNIASPAEGQPRNSNNTINSCLDDKDETDDSIESIERSQHSDTMIRTQPHSMLYEASTSDTIATLTSLSAQTDLGFTEMPTRDWIQMQSKIQVLETEVSHVSRTNRLLNDELDKLTGILARLTAGDEEFKNLDDGQKQVEGGSSSSSQPGWRREYEFLVQQVDLMHRQLQAAQSELGGRTTPQGRARGEDTEVVRSTEVTRQLHAEVKDLTASLKMWQSALQRTDSQYRRKCEDERALKQTLRERECELSSLMEKLEQSKDQNSSSSSDSGTDKTSNNGQGGMPGTFPEALSTKAVEANTRVANQLAVSLVSWAALLVTSMIS
ncbi:hypothetical protein BGZ68_009523 [Mortierella alpina]|nr:hypothetical protein BGZ68_009523 [Mortierella alpina]